MRRAIRDLGADRFNGKVGAQLDDALVLQSYWFPSRLSDDELNAKFWDSNHPPKPTDPPADPLRVKRALLRRINVLREKVRGDEAKRRHEQRHKAKQAESERQYKTRQAEAQADVNALSALDSKDVVL